MEIVLIDNDAIIPTIASKGSAGLVLMLILKLVQ